MANENPTIWIFSTGTEILQGAGIDSNSPWLSLSLLELGLATARHMALPDRGDLLREALIEAATKCDLLITTGGLGPTGDDLNRNLIAEVWGAPLEKNDEALERMKKRFQAWGRPMPPSNDVQAYVPRGGIILQNDHGTAPGFYMHPGGSVRAGVLALPGPPHEMRPMFESARQLIIDDFAHGLGRPRTLTLHTVGLGESSINDLVADFFERDPRMTFALLAKPGLVDVRMTFFGRDDAESVAMENEWRARIVELVGARHVFGENATTLEDAVGALLRQKGQTVAVAESCTAGLLAARLTESAGSSDYFVEGFVTYANEAKHARLGVSEELLARFGAVSAEVAGAMAAGARKASGADWAVSITGIAGPGGGSDEKPVGLVFFGIAGPDGSVKTERRQFLGARAVVRSQATIAALNLLRRGLLAIAD
ncbi:competence/damage-inducible protein A [bacterium]|nr:competence/damage-inducible protein A [bacterium]